MKEVNMPNEIKTESTNKTLFRDLFKGTTLGLCGRFIFFPLEHLSTVRSQTQLTYAQIWKDTKIYAELGKIFGRTTFLPNIAKSLSNMGVVVTVSKYRPDLNKTPIIKGLVVAGISSFLEAATNAKGEYERVRQMLKDDTQPVKSIKFFNKNDRKLTPEIKRILTATYVRALGCGVMTFCSIFTVADKLNPIYPEWMSSAVKAGISGAIGGGLAQIPNMPFVNFHAYAVRHIKQSTYDSLKHFMKSPGKFKGFVARFANRSAFYGATFFAEKVWDEYMSKFNHSHKSNQITTLKR